MSARPLSQRCVALVYPRKLDDIGQGCSSSIAMMFFHRRGDSIVDSNFPLLCHI